MDILLNIWPSIGAIAADIGLPYPTVSSWRRRGIPARRYADIIRAAKARGASITFEQLSALPPQKKDTAA